MKKSIRQFTCWHAWQERLVFGSGKTTHHDIKKCIKCGKSKTIFSGSREEWYKRNGFDYDYFVLGRKVEMKQERKP